MSKDRNHLGLSKEEAAKKLREYGYNELPSEKERDIFRIILEVFREPMFILLVACGLLYLILGDIHEALILLGFVFIIIGITIYQEKKTEKALHALRNLASPRALVIRDGEHMRIAGREVVMGDLLLLSQGDRVPADAVLVEENNLLVDESILTGESVNVPKQSGGADLEMEKPGGENTPFVYSGTMVVDGQAMAIVKGIGLETEIGRIGKMLHIIEEERTPLQKEMARIVRAVSFIGLTICLGIALLYYVRYRDLINGFLAGLSLAMAILPEEFPVILTVFLSLGAWRISKKKVLARKMSAVETLGSATVLCTDKTGTLTENKMELTDIWAEGVRSKANKAGGDKKNCDLATYARLASKSDPFDPMEKAIGRFYQKPAFQDCPSLEELSLVREYPLDRKFLAYVNVWRNDKDLIVAAKGAPETIIGLCHLTQTEAAKLMDAVEGMAREGIRVLAVAGKISKDCQLPDDPFEIKLGLTGLIGLTDPVRSSVPTAIRAAQDAGIKVVMITGDYPETAKSIARTIGLEFPDVAMTGIELEELDEKGLADRIGSLNIFARVVPEQKLRIIRALKARGEIVAMTGDGVNDAPALKAAHIGVAMGERGTDVAREASDIVLLDDSFSSLVEGVRVGRRIFYNIRKAIAYTFAIHIPIVGLSLIPVLLGWPLILSPVHIVFLELIIDPVCSLLFEAEKAAPDIMRRRPRNPKKGLFDAKLLWISLLQGIGILAAVIAMYRAGLQHADGSSFARALAFTTLIFANLFLIMVNRSWSDHFGKTIMKKNKVLIWIFIFAVFFLTLVLYWPWAANIFRFSPLGATHWLAAILAAAISTAWFEIYKVFKRR